MIFAIIILCLYVIPIYVGIHLLYYILRIEGYTKVGKVIYKILVVGLAVFYIVVNVRNWWNTHHIVDFQINKKYLIHLQAIEQETFLDWQVDFEIEITDVKTGQEYYFEFGEGDFGGLEFFVIDGNDNIIYLVDSQNHMNAHKINLIRNKIDNYNMTFPARLTAELTTDFRIIKKNQKRMDDRK